jgi:branched-subunit amino acid aminotransferase/4-amino-4-deoxychorismate lyase
LTGWAGQLTDWGIVVTGKQIRQALLDHAAGTTGQHKTRLLLAQDGSYQIESAPLLQIQQPLKVALATTPVDPTDLLLYLKTEQRERYEQARQEQPAADEVLLCNDRGELTEGSFTNLVLKLDNRLVTPTADQWPAAGRYAAGPIGTRNNY